MELGAFSVSLAVQDIRRSREFYEVLGFTPSGGKEEENWLIMRKGHAVIGLFQGMFEGNILTFNPGWDQDARESEAFTDVREWEKHLSRGGLQTHPNWEGPEGPGSLTLSDPDGNVILLDQHR